MAVSNILIIDFISLNKFYIGVIYNNTKIKTPIEWETGSAFVVIFLFDFFSGNHNLIIKRNTKERRNIVRCTHKFVQLQSFRATQHSSSVT